jgi:hypothetical protein
MPALQLPAATYWGLSEQWGLPWGTNETIYDENSRLQGFLERFMKT